MNTGRWIAVGSLVYVIVLFSFLVVGEKLHIPLLTHIATGMGLLVAIYVIVGCFVAIINDKSDPLS